MLSQILNYFHSKTTSMKTYLTTTIFLLLLLFTGIQFVKAQDTPIKPARISTGKFLGETLPLRDYPPLTAKELRKLERKAAREAKEEADREFQPRYYPYSSTALPKGPDPVWQKSMGKAPSGGGKAPIVNFDAQTTTLSPPDCNGTIGPNHYMQTINLTYAIYSRTGTVLKAPTAMNTIFGSVTGSGNNDGDPLIQWDEQAQRWIAVEFSISGTNDYMLVAVSTTNDPTGTWYKYSFDVADMPDYEKIGIWQDGYYMATNTGSGNDIYVLERSKMLSGLTAQMIAFDNPWRPGFGFMLAPPLDNDGAFAPAGTPGTFIAFNDDAVGGGKDQLWLYELTANWTTPASSTFTRSQQIDVASFDSQFTQDWTDIEQKGTTQRLDGVPAIIMNAPQYRNFGTYQTIVCCHTVDVDNTNHSGVRWYELRKTPPATTWTVRQQGTYAPDANSRWMASVMLNGAGKIGMGYSISSSTVFPGIRYCGQSASGYAAANGQMDIPEAVIQDGTIAQTVNERWGDYSLLSVDPTDDQTFWFTSEYMKSASNKGTRVASFKFTNLPNAITRAATALTGTTSTLNGTVNANGLATTYHFEWGTTTAYGTSTSTISAGSGLTDVLVNAGITGLTAGTTYHFRLVAVNSDGTSNGDDITFKYGTAIVRTIPVSNLGSSTVTCGGEITSDGGYAVTARGVCWGTTLNPVATGNHTTDGTGTGTFVSSVTGLATNTTYHIRAYATTANGTVYGSDLIFATYCGTYTAPFTEAFSTTQPACWSQIDIFGDGYTWQFGTTTGPSLTGSYAYMMYNSGTIDCDLITPTLDLSSLASITLSFKHYFKFATGRSAAVSYSIDNGTTWTVLQTYTATSATNPVTFSQVIPAVAGQSQVKFKWNFSGTGSTTTYWGIDDVSVTGIVPQWTGTTSTDWNTASNWNISSVPTAPISITIPSSLARYPVISTSGFQCANLTIASGASVTINPTGSLTVNRTLTNSAGNTGLVIKSSAAGTGSLITNSTGVSATVERYLTGGSTAPLPWHYISTSVTGQSIPSLVGTLTGVIATNGTKYGLAPYDNAIPNWVPYTTSTLAGAGNFTLGKGYEMLFSTAGTTSFAGTLTAANTTIAITTPVAPGNAWNLIGNPFPSALCANSNAQATDNFLDVNTTIFESGYKAIYLWNAATGAYNIINNVKAASYIPVGQAFFVKSVSGGSTANFTTALRTHNTAAYSKSSRPEWPLINLHALANGKNSSTEFYFVPETTHGLDEGYDAGMFDQTSSQNSVYSMIEGSRIKFAIQALPENSFSELSVPIGINVPAGTTVTFNADILDLPENVQVYIKDLENMTTTRLDLPGSSYSVVIKDTNNISNRFVLATSQLLVTNIKPDDEAYKIVAMPRFQKIIITNGGKPGTAVNIYATNGQLLTVANLENTGENEIPFHPWSDGVYIVKIQTESRVISHKITWFSSTRTPLGRIKEIKIKKKKHHE